MAAPEHSFAEARTAAVAAGEGRLVVTDRGRSVWRRAAGRPAHGARLRSSDRFLPDGRVSAADGGWWELAPGVQTVTPAMFGCGPDVADNAPGLTEFYAWLERFGGLACHEGRFPVRSGIVMGTGDGPGEGEGGSSTVLGRLDLDVAAPIAGAVVTCRSRRETRIEAMAIAGGGSPAYADKRFDIGLLIEGARGQTIEHLEVADARLFGVLASGRGDPDGEGASGNRIGTAEIRGCGSGRAAGGAGPGPEGAFLEAGHVLLVAGGEPGAYYQTTTFELKPGSPLPPPALEAEGLACFVTIGGEDFPVALIDRGANRVTVWGRVPVETPPRGRIGFAFGGGWGSADGAGGVEIGHLIVADSAIGHQLGATGPAAVRATMERNHIGQAIGTSPGGASPSGLTVGRFEGNDADIWFLARPDARSGESRVVADPAAGPVKVRWHGGGGGEDFSVGPDWPAGLVLSDGGEECLDVATPLPPFAGEEGPNRRAVGR